MLSSLRILVLSVMGALVFITLALSFVLLPGESETGESSPLVAVAGVMVLGLVLHLVIEAVGYRAEPIDPAASPQQAATQARTAMQTGTTVRLALADSVAILSLALAFVLSSGGFVLYVVGAVISVGLLAFHAFPWSRPIARVDAALQRDGASSPLRAELGLPPA